MPNGTRERKRYIAGVAIETGFYAGSTETSRETDYTFKDHLGSIDVITNGSGTVTQELSFGAWGQRRDASNWTETTEISSIKYLIDLGTTFDSSKTTRGFTGHEMVDAVGVINMNGRIYDPILGRLLQADPFVQDAKNSQSLNRYSYVLNNPLNATDPSGYFVFSLIAIAIASTTIDIGIYTVMTLFAIAGTLDAVALGADWSNALQSGLISGVSAGAFFKVGKFLGDNYLSEVTGALSDTGFTIKILAHGVVGGITNTLLGGKFGHGFAAAFATATATTFNRSGIVGGDGPSLARVVVAAAIGGSVSKLTGGKFANGAMTGAFSQALNAEVTEAESEGIESDDFPPLNETDIANIAEESLRLFYLLQNDGVAGLISQNPLLATQSPQALEMALLFASNDVTSIMIASNSKDLGQLIVDGQRLTFPRGRVGILNSLRKVFINPKPTGPVAIPCGLRGCNVYVGARRVTIGD